MNLCRWQAEKADDEWETSGKYQTQKNWQVPYAFPIYVAAVEKTEQQASGCFSPMNMHISGTHQPQPFLANRKSLRCISSPHRLPKAFSVWNSAGSVFLPFLPLPHHTYQTCIMVWRYYLTKHSSPSLDFHSCFSKRVAFLIIAWCLLPGESELSS